MHGVIVKGIGGFYYVMSDSDIYECKARGIFRNENIIPMVGDRVIIEEKSGRFSIAKILPRDNFLIRPPVANIQQLVVTVAAANPEPNLKIIDSFLLMSEYNDIETLICVNKTDLENADELSRIYTGAGYRVICTSAEKNEGIEELRAAISGKVSAFTGNSGVGKSSLLNALGIKNHMETGKISDKTKRGRHTTRHVELLELPEGGYVLDTPGFSSFEMPNIEAAKLELFFREFAPYLGKCRFRGCAHVNEPDCAVKEALAEGKISQSRYDSYVNIYNERKAVKPYMTEKQEGINRG